MADFGDFESFGDLQDSAVTGTAALCNLLKGHWTFEEVQIERTDFSFK